jgi:hypothetical protein
MADKAVATKTADLPPAKIEDDDFSGLAGSGLGSITARDMMVPRLGIIQSLSPQLKKGNAAYIDGATEGDIADLGTGEIFKDGVIFLPVHYRKDFIEWFPRNTGKGIANIHHDPSVLDQTTQNERRQNVLPNGNLIIETAQFFGLNLSAGRRRCFIPMASTQLKKARRWITVATGEKLKRPDGSEFTAPFFYRSYTLTTAAENNADGDWKGWVITRGPALPELDLGVPWRVIKDEAVDFSASLVAGEAQADMSSINEEGTGESRM